MKTKSYFQMPRYFRRIRNVEPDDILRQVGLQPRRNGVTTFLSAAGVFATGIVLGATLGMAFAPRKGEHIRRDVRAKAETMKARVGQYKERARPGGDGGPEAPPPAGP